MTARTAGSSNASAGKEDGQTTVRADCARAPSRRVSRGLARCTSRALIGAGRAGLGAAALAVVHGAGGRVRTLASASTPVVSPHAAFGCWLLIRLPFSPPVRSARFLALSSAYTFA